MRRDWPRLDLPAVETRTSLDPNTLWSHPLGFLVQWQLGEITHGREIDDDGALVMFLLDHDGNRAEVACADDPGTGDRLVRQYGPRQLWDEVEQAAAFWKAEAHPSYDRFGLTAAPDHQTVWLDKPNGPHHWPLPLPRATRPRSGSPTAR